MLHPETRCGKNFREQIVVLACVHDELKGKTDDQRQHRQLDQQAHPKSVPCDERCENDRYDQNDEDEARAAARMESFLCADVFNGQIQSLLIAEDRFVFGTVILKGAFNVIHKGNSPYIQYKDADTQTALNDIFEPAEIAARKSIQSLGDEHRQIEEQPEAQRNTEYTGKNHDDVKNALAEGFFQPFFKLCRFFFLQTVGIGRDTEHFVGKNKAFNHIDDAADDRQTQQLVLITDGRILVVGNADLFILLTKCDGIRSARLHHDAFQNRLTADFAALACQRIGAAVLFGCLFFFFCHEYPLSPLPGKSDLLSVFGIRKAKFPEYLIL